MERGGARGWEGSELGRELARMVGHALAKGYAEPSEIADALRGGQAKEGEWLPLAKMRAAARELVGAGAEPGGLEEFAKELAGGGAEGAAEAARAALEAARERAGAAVELTLAARRSLR